jgi:hypothetical protein
MPTAEVCTYMGHEFLILEAEKNFNQRTLI